MTKPKAKERSMGLAEYARQGRLAEARARCSVCSLPDDVKEELKEAARRGTERRWQIAWLKARGHDISNTELTTHRNGGHDG